MEPEKPFACTLPDCGMTFTNEDHLHVHTKKHDMVLQLGMEQKVAFVADQTPTPTRFIRNCEEVGLFQDLQNVNPFDEGFKRAMETKHSLSLETSAMDDVLHTPHLVLPLEAGDCALYTNNQRNITISRSSSDESGAVKEYETTTISKLTNEVTTISRVVGKDVLDRVTTTDDVIVRHEETARKDGFNETSVSYTNNVIKIHSNVEIRKDGHIDKTHEAKDGKMEKIPPIMSQKSLDFVVDSLNTEEKNMKRAKKDKDTEDYEVIIKLPNGKHVRMKTVEECEQNAKEKLNSVIRNRAKTPNVVPLTAGTLIPVTIVSPPLAHNHIPKIPIVPITNVKTNYKRVKRKVGDKDEARSDRGPDDKIKQGLESRSAASKRYRERLKQSMHQQSVEMQQLRESNSRLAAERAVLQHALLQHLRTCPVGQDLRNVQEKLQNASQFVKDVNNG
ncbi:atf2 [Danaus plexippus plexippus]|uniref:Atf2 n=1 Tax=Danaus plexippus plexippus TaxID=278856 RepID=A0A212EKW2_DANPL|nr:atf2 [Danaus plexippus plexippus]